MVKELKADEAVLSTGEVLPYGLTVWSTGVGPTNFTTGLDFAKTARGRIAIDGELRVLQSVDPSKAKHTELHKPADVSSVQFMGPFPVEQHTSSCVLAGAVELEDVLCVVCVMECSHLLICLCPAGNR